MRCPSCGGIPQHLVTDLAGRSFYQCGTGLSRFKKDGSRTPIIEPCGTITDNMGRQVDGAIAYQIEGGIRTLIVKDGQITS